MNFHLTSFTRGLAKWRELEPTHRRVFLSAFVLMPLFWLGLRILGLARMLTLLAPGPARVCTSMSPDEARALGRMVNIAARRGPLRATCLVRALLLYWLLRRRGVASQVRIGVRLANGKLQAHAWVESQGIPLDDQPDVALRFIPFTELVPARAFSHP